MKMKSLPIAREQKQQQTRLNFTLLVSVFVLHTHCFQVGQVIYVYMHYGDFYMDVLSVVWSWSRVCAAVGAVSEDEQCFVIY